jgi:hydrogenase large subunit
MRDFLERVLFASTLEEIAALDSEATLARWLDAGPAQGDLRLFLSIAQDLQLRTLGRGPQLTLSYGSLANPDGVHAFAPGVWDGARLHAVNTTHISEDARHSWLAENDGPAHPTQGLTQPNIDKAGAYTWNKAPRLHGKVIETGALARQLADGQPLVRALWAHSGGNVMTRVLARAIELARLVLWAEQALRAVQPDAPCCAEATLPANADAEGLCEAARGSLGHWISIRDGAITNYQIIAPTSWNFSPRDRHGTPGALEAALVGAPVLPGETAPVAVQHIVRSFDPCMVCTVH